MGGGGGGRKVRRIQLRDKVKRETGKLPTEHGPQGPSIIQLYSIRIQEWIHYWKGGIIRSLPFKGAGEVMDPREMEDWVVVLLHDGYLAET